MEDSAPLCPGSTVIINGLSVRSDLNGKAGLVLRYDLASARYVIEIGNAEPVLIKASNLLHTDYDDSLDPLLDPLCMDGDYDRDSG